MVNIYSGTTSIPNIANLAFIFITLKRLPALSIPIHTRSISCLFVYFPAWMVFTCAVFYSALIRAVLSATPMFNLADEYFKRFTAIKALFRYIFSWVSSGFIEALLGTVQPPVLSCSFVLVNAKLIIAVGAYPRINQARILNSDPEALARAKHLWFTSSAREASSKDSTTCGACHIWVKSMCLARAINRTIPLNFSYGIKWLAAMLANKLRHFLRSNRKAPSKDGAYRLEFGTRQWVITPFKPIGIIPQRASD